MSTVSCKKMRIVARRPGKYRKSAPAALYCPPIVPPQDTVLHMRHTLHAITQPLTTIVLTTELKIALGEADTDCTAVYTAALQLRDLVGELQRTLHSATPLVSARTLVA